MADESIRSNLILKTSVQRPNREGFIKIKRDLKDIDSALAALTGQPHVIRITADVDEKLDAILSGRIPQVQAGGTGGGSAGRPPGGGGAAGGAGGGGGGSTVPPAGAGGRGNLNRRKVTITPGEEGDNISILEREVTLLQGQEIIEENIADEKGNIKKISEEVVNLEKEIDQQLEKQRQKREKLKQEAQLELKARQAAIQRRFGRPGERETVRFGGVNFREDLDKVKATTDLEGNQTLIREFRAPLDDANDRVLRVNESMGKVVTTTERAIDKTREQDAQLRKLRDQFGEPVPGGLSGRDVLFEGTRLQETKSREINREGKPTVFAREFRGQLDDTNDLVVRVNESTGRVGTTIERNTERIRQQNQELRATEKQQRKLAKAALKEQLDEERDRQRGILRGRNQQTLEVGGFTQFNTITKTTAEGQERITEHFRQTKGVLEGYEVEIARLNEKTGEMNTRTIRGAQAVRFLGDSLANAANKVLLWTLATGAVFATLNLFRQVGREVIELEANTIFLTRVGRNLVQTSGDIEVSFNDQLSAARRLTSGIVDLTLVYGGSATEAQRAAAIFLRSGQNVEETLDAVRASLLAARIAEIEVEDAAILLSSALQQFNLEAKQLLPTLDSLNTLSNNYRVTTDDLLKSISKAGSTFAEHNGRLSELAAITTVVAERTAASGSKIGNAIKTVQSRLDQLDTRKALFEGVGLSTVNLEGQTINLSKLLLILKSRIDDLNEVDQKRLTLQLGGVRRRNLLVAAIEEVERAIIAENKALLDSGSSLEEFGDRSGTIEAAMERLQAVISALAEAAQGPLGFLLDNIASLIAGILKLTTVFGGLPIKIGIVVAAFLLLRAGFNKLFASGGLLAKTFVDIQVRALTAATAVRHFGLASARAALQMRVQAAAARVGAASMSLFRLSMGDVTALISLVALPLLAGATNELTALSDATAEATRAADAQVSAEERRLKAFRNSKEAIFELFLEIERIEDKGGDNASQRISRLEDTARRIADSVDLELPNGGSGAERLNKFAISAARQERQRIEELNNARQDKLRNTRDQIRLTQEELRTAKILASYERGEFLGSDPLSRTRGDSILGNIAAGFDSANVTDVYQTIADAVVGGDEVRERTAETNVAKLEEKLKQLSESESGLVSQIENDSAKLLDPAKRLKDYRLQVELLASQSRVAADKQKQLVREITGSTLGSDDLQRNVQLEKEISRELEKQDQLLKDLNENSPARDQEILVDSYKRVNELVNRRLKATKDILATESKVAQSFFGQRFETRTNLDVEARRIALEREVGLGERPELSSGISGIDAERTALRSRIEARNRDVARIESLRANRENIQRAIREKERQLTVPRSRRSFDLIDDEIDRLKSDLSLASDARRGADFSEAVRKKNAEDLARLKELEAEKALEILRAEKEIAIERKKSADEAVRALGALSQEDKLRVAAQAAFFAEDPDRKVSARDRFLASAEDTKILDQFFKGRSDSRLDPKADPFSKTLIDAGFGTDPDVEASARDLERIRRGRSDTELLETAARRSDLAEEERIRLERGEDVASGLADFDPSAAPFVGGDSAGNVTPRIDVSVDRDSFNFAPLVTAFEDAVDTILQDRNREIEEIVTDIVSRERALPETKTPSAGGGAGGEL